MDIESLNHASLLDLDPESGVIRFAGQRALLLDAVAMGLLRKYLVENFGLTAARTILTQFGFAHGWRMAETLQAEFNWQDTDELRRAAAKLHGLQGLFRIEGDSDGLLDERGAMLMSSFEAEQHIVHFGRSDTAVCWTICGLISGLLSQSSGHEIYVLEQRCMCKGDAACHLFARTREAWGDDRADDLQFFETALLKECLDVSLKRVTDTLKETENKLQSHRRTLVRVAPQIDGPLGMITRSTAMRRIIDLARRVAKVDSTLLVTGESGVGKERIARLVHDESTRAAGPFVAINCGAITESLLESELFGHARGAFTGARSDRAGLFEAANGGTLLLDEIGEVSPAMQVKLLRVLQERELRRVGENRTRRINVRVIAATNRHLLDLIETGDFRQDLYYRLNVVELHVPPLRERREDILPLARLLLAEASERLERAISTFAPGVADQLLRYTWPGNVRELENAMERAVVLALGDRVELGDLPEEIREAVPVPIAAEGRVRPLEEVERDYILAVLELNDENRTHTARQLEIGTATLYRKLKRYGVNNTSEPLRSASRADDTASE